MDQAIPPPEEVRRRLELLSWAETQELCKRTGVPFTTVWKLRQGETTNPRIETLRAIWPDLQAPAEAKAEA